MKGHFRTTNIEEPALQKNQNQAHFMLCDSVWPNRIQI